MSRSRCDLQRAPFAPRPVLVCRLYQSTRTHLALDKDCPDPRLIMPRRIGKVVAIPQVGVVVVICAAILGQMAGSYLADTLGWFGVQRIPFNPIRLAGIGLLVLGVLLVQRK